MEHRPGSNPQIRHTSGIAPARRTVLGQIGAWATAGGIAWSACEKSGFDGNGAELPSGRSRILLDSDAANYFDDQFAIAYAALSTDAIQIEGLYAAPFVNSRVDRPSEGVSRSFEAIDRVLGTLPSAAGFPVLEGSPSWISDSGGPIKSPAAEHIVDRVMGAGPEIDYIVSIGAPTNVASALLMEPQVRHRTALVWLGGTPHHFASASEFNLQQDPEAVRVLLEAGVKLMHVPAPGLAENLRATREELEARMTGTSAVADYLIALLDEFGSGARHSATMSRTEAIWDLAAVAWLVNPRWVESVIVPSPFLSEELTWRPSDQPHRVRLATRVLRDEVMTDFFTKVANATPQPESL